MANDNASAQTFSVAHKACRYSVILFMGGVGKFIYRHIVYTEWAVAKNSHLYNSLQGGPKSDTILVFKLPFSLD